MKEYLSVKERTENEYVVQRSVFIATVTPVSDAEEVFKEAIEGFKIYSVKSEKTQKNELKAPGGEEFSAHRQGITCRNK